MEVRTVYSGQPRARYKARAVYKIESGNGVVTRTVISKSKSRRRVSKRWRGVDKLLRRMGRAQQASSSDYLRRHERSNSKKKNGAIRDLTRNVSRSQRKGLKRLKLLG